MIRWRGGDTHRVHCTVEAGGFGGIKETWKNDILFINIRNLKVIFDKRNIVFIVSK